MAVYGQTLIWLTLVNRKKNSLPTISQLSSVDLFSKAPKEAEPVSRRLITLIFADWLPHDVASSWSCLGLVTGVQPYGLSISVIEGSPGRGCAPMVALQRCSIRSLNILRQMLPIVL